MKKTIALLFITFSFSAFAGTALTHILKRGTLRVCTTGDYPPLTRLRLGKYSGTTIIAARAFAKTLSVKADFIHATRTNMGTLLNAGHCDIAMGGITATPIRANAFLMTAPVSTTGKIPLVRCSDKAKYTSLKTIDHKGVRVVENLGSTNEAFAKAHIKHASIMITPIKADAFDYLLQSVSDVMFTDKTEALYRQKTMPGLCAANSNHLLTHSHKVYLIAHDNQALLQKMNAFIHA
jgi:cyclohexadienyl dehydratase